MVKDNNKTPERRYLLILYLFLAYLLLTLLGCVMFQNIQWKSPRAGYTAVLF